MCRNSIHNSYFHATIFDSKHNNTYFVLRKYRYDKIRITALSIINFVYFSKFLEKLMKIHCVKAVTQHNRKPEFTLL